MSDFKKGEKTFHILFDENGKLRKLIKHTDERGHVTYKTERPQPLRAPEEPACSLCIYELVIGFQHDTYKCKFCGKEEKR